MDPITLAALASIGATGFGLLQGTEATKEAEELAKKQAKQDALMNLIRAAGGSPPVPTQQVAVPQVDYASAMQNLASTGLMYAGGKSNQAESAANAAYDMERTAALQREAAAMGSQPDMQTMRNVAPTGYAGPLQMAPTDPLKSSQTAENIARTKLIEAQTAEKVAGTKAMPSTPNQATLRNAAPTSVGTQDLVIESAGKTAKGVLTSDQMSDYRALQQKASTLADLTPDEQKRLAFYGSKLNGAAGSQTVDATEEDDPWNPYAR